MPPSSSSSARRNRPSSGRTSDLIVNSSKPNRPYRGSLHRDAADDDFDVALKTALATEEIGIATLVKLKTQSEQLHNIEDQIASTDQVLTSTGRSIRSMDSFWGRVKNTFTKSHPKSEIQARRDREAKQVQKVESAKAKVKAKQQQQRSSSSKPQRRSGLDHDDRMDTLSESVRNLNYIAQDMNNELTDQSRILTGIDQDMASVQSRLKQQNDQIKRL